MGNMSSVALPVVLDTLDSSASTLCTEKIISDEEESTGKWIQEMKLL